MAIIYISFHTSVVSHKVFFFSFFLKFQFCDIIILANFFQKLEYLV
jgi:hypothetical protein